MKQKNKENGQKYALLISTEAASAGINNLALRTQFQILGNYFISNKFY